MWLRLPYILSVVLIAQIALASDMAGDIPEEPGVYYLQDRKGTAPEWIRLGKVTVDGVNAGGMKTFLDTGGHTNLNTTIAYQGATSGMVIANSNPTFFIRKAESVKNLRIVRLARAQDRRVIRTSPFSASRDNRAGFRPGDIFRLNFKENPDGSHTAMPERPLPAGEYLLTADDALSGYDFTISD
ncbi:MAG TPA: hypothetical protein VLL97_06005 [Acidobacteriota bacterium]|nr:hypothetical protein [Acidobacteriota bacterium]